MRQLVLVAAATVSLCGCGRGYEVKPPSLKEALATFEESVAEARNELIESERTKDTEDEEAAGPSGGGERRERDSKTARPVQAVVAAANYVATFAAGTRHETDVNALVADAQQLETKAKGTVTVAEVDQAMQQLLSKAAALKAKL